MRVALSSNAEVAHYFANNVQSHGRGSNFFFERDRLYSYGRHFCIARRFSNGAIAFTTRGYSVSTSRHISLARAALRNRKLVYCNDPDASAYRNMESARHDIETQLTAMSKKGIRQATKEKLQALVLHIAEEANEYLAALPDNEREGVTPIDTSNFDAWREQLAAAQREKEAADAARREESKARQKEHLALWRVGNADTAGMWNLPPALRLKGDMVETSHGAAIPVSDALQFWPLVQSVRSGERTSDDARRIMHRLGVYTLTRINPDGSIVVGCHNIDYSELRLIAGQLGLQEDAA